MLDKFFNGELRTEDSKVNFKQLFKVMKGLGDANPLDVISDKNVSDSFIENCAFSKGSESELNSRARLVEQSLVAFKESKMSNVQKIACNSNKTFDSWFACLESIQSVKREIELGVLGIDIEDSWAHSEHQNKEELKEGETMIKTQEPSIMA